MAMQLEDALDRLPLPTLLELSIIELQRYRSKALADEGFIIELLRRALVEQSDEGWAALEQCFGGIVRSWLRNHSYSDMVLRWDSEENYIAQAFERFWYAVRDQHLVFSTLPAALRYLHATLNGLLTDAMRSHLRQRTREAPLPEPGCPEEPCAEDALESERLWQGIQRLLVNERERRLFFLLYGCGLKPREVVSRCPREFNDVQEVYRLTNNILERLRRNRDRLYYLLGNDD